MNTTINIYGDEIIVQRGDLIIKRSLSSFANSCFEPAPAPRVHTFTEREVEALYANLKDSKYEGCQQRKVSFEIHQFGLCHGVFIVDGDDRRSVSGLCDNCDCL